MKGRGVIAAAVLVMSTSGCWLQSGFGAGKTANNDLEKGITAANVTQLAPDWTASLGGPTANEPLVDGGTAYVRSAGRVSSLDLGTGATRWSVAAGTANDVMGGSAAVPALVGGSLWVPTTGQACNLVQINPVDGTTVGVRFYDGLPPGSVPPTAILAARCRTGDALAAGTRIVVPSMSVAQIAPGTPINSCPGGADLFFATTRVSVIETAATGPGWVLAQDTFNCGSPAPTPAPFQPVSQSGDLVLVAQGSVVTAYPLADCPPFTQPCPAVWSVEVGGPVVGAPVLLSSGDVAAGRIDGQVAVIDGTTHAVEWTASVGPRLFFPLAATPTSIYAVSNDSAATTTIVSALPAGGCGSTTCTPTWTSTMPSNPAGRASIGGDVLYVTHGRLVSALPAAGCGDATCAPLWEAAAPTTLSSPSSPPVIDNGELLVGRRDGTVAAFALPA
jgi:outer membrane protein assembly factor BamB